MPPVLATTLLARVRQEMALRNYAPRTVDVYLSCLRRYALWLAPTPPREAEAETPRSWLVQLVELGASRTSVDQHVSALKFLYVELYGWDEDRLSVPRPRRGDHLPDVPSKSDVLRLAHAVDNHKHRLAILFLYATGVRVSELVALDVGDIDLHSGLVRVRSGKGDKDRLTVLARRIIPDLQRHIGDRSRLCPLFAARGGRRWSVRSVQHVVQKARERAGIDMKVTPHTLRHAFATHLLEAGTDMRVIQQLLGHRHITTTTRYARMRNPARMSILSPLDVSEESGWDRPDGLC